MESMIITSVIHFFKGLTFTVVPLSASLVTVAQRISMQTSCGINILGQIHTLKSGGLTLQEQRSSLHSCHKHEQFNFCVHRVNLALSKHLINKGIKCSFLVLQGRSNRGCCHVEIEKFRKKLTYFTKHIGPFKNIFWIMFFELLFIVLPF